MKIVNQYIVKSLLIKNGFCLMVETEEGRFFKGENTNVYTFFEIHPTEAKHLIKQSNQ